MRYHYSLQGAIAAVPPTDEGARQRSKLDVYVDDTKPPPTTYICDNTTASSSVPMAGKSPNEFSSSDPESSEAESDQAVEVRTLEHHSEQ